MTTKTKKLSLVRLAVLIVIVSSVLYVITSEVKEVKIYRDNAVPIKDPWFAPYVDVTAKPTYSFEQLGSTDSSDVILSFIVASNDDVCIPTWGTYFTLDEASSELDLDRRIARLRQQGGNVAVSFGGAINNELSSVCLEHDKLVNAYKSVIDRYNIDTIDLDIEGSNLADQEASVRRATAIAQIQAEKREKDSNLAIWITLPVTPQGLTNEGTNAIKTLLENGVDLAGINAMTMDYGESKARTQSMYEASKSALIETQRQLGIIYKQVGKELTNKTLWRKIGSTPMIGQNDFVREIFTIEDAEKLNEFTTSQSIGRMSMWSANRDIACGDNYVDTSVVSDSCSGVNAEKASFANVLSQGFTGTLSQNADTVTEEEIVEKTDLIDDPEKSPYQVWQENGVYPKGVKVVWHGNVYEAKWWTKNDLPDNPVLQSWETPWQLIGPVLPNEKPIQQPTLPTGTYPKWYGTTIYEGGDRVLFEGVPFQAKWWNQGESPAASKVNPDSSPWLPLTQRQIEDIIKSL